MDEANKKVEYFCGRCQKKINKNGDTILCTACDKWIHKRCVSIPWPKAVKNKQFFKCKNCEGGDKVPKVASNPNVTDVEKLTKMVLLFEDDVRSFGGDISNTDLKSLENGGWVTDNIISLVFGNIQQYVNGNKLALVEPSVTQILRKSPDPGTVAKTVEDLKLKEMDYVFFPVNNNDKVDGEGGSHWSLLVYISDKRHVKFYHHDPISGANHRHANELIKNLSKANTFFKSKPKIEEVVVPEQVNGYDCGIYTVIYAGMLVSDITNGFAPKLINITPEEVSKCRKTLRQKISGTRAVKGE